MATYLGVIADTGGRADFWAIARAQRVEPLTDGLPSQVLIDCWEKGWPAFEAPPRLARELSRALARPCIAVVAQTAASVLEVQAFDAGTAIRVLLHADTDGWTRVEGEAQPWEAALLFGDDDGAEEDPAGSPRSRRAVVPPLRPRSAPALGALAEAVAARAALPAMTRGNGPPGGCIVGE